MEEPEKNDERAILRDGAAAHVFRVGGRKRKVFLRLRRAWHGGRYHIMEILIIILNMKKSLLSFAALFLAQLTASAVVDLGSTISRTPYDAYMSPVKQVFNSLNGNAPDMGRVAALMRYGSYGPKADCAEFPFGSVRKTCLALQASRPAPSWPLRI